MMSRKDSWTIAWELRLTFYKQLLRSIANSILDIRLQTMNMTDQQALDLMINDTFQEKEEATAKLQRAQLTSCQLPTYFVGFARLAGHNAKNTRSARARRSCYLNFTTRH